MGLVEYSESSGSEAEDSHPQKSKVPPQPTSNSNNKPTTFHKVVVDRSDTHKIRINLPELAKEPAAIDLENDGEPPAKKARVGGGGFSGFNSFLPAPKRAIATGGGANGAGGRRGGLGSGVNLKTGATPGFSREPMPGANEDEEERPEVVNGNGAPEPKGDGSDSNGIKSLPEPKSLEKHTEEPKKQGNPMMFKPLSVARKPQKKKPLPPPPNTSTSKASEPPTPPPPKLAPKVSLFSTETAQEEQRSQDTTTKNNTYQPLIYGTTEPDDPPISSPSQPIYPLEPESPATHTPFPTPQAPIPQSLSTIATDLNLSASATRQLLGRHHHPSSSSSAINIVNFNTDAEYAANELLRQAGEQVQHNPVRAINPGKHSLKQLVSAASGQKEALEEQFASGRRNRREAGGKYGW
ncbi:MAG: hypothetical protein Q9220_006626 [cf. Caloplaca sp. 1 TL-2023]